MASKLSPIQQAIFDFLDSELEKQSDRVTSEFELLARTSNRIVNAIRAEDRVALTWELRVLFSLGEIGIDIESILGLEKLTAWVQALVLLNHAALARGEHVPGYGGVPETPFWCRPVDWKIGGLV